MICTEKRDTAAAMNSSSDSGTDLSIRDAAWYNSDIETDSDSSQSAGPASVRAEVSETADMLLHEVSLPPRAEGFPTPMIMSFQEDAIRPTEHFSPSTPLTGSKAEDFTAVKLSSIAIQDQCLTTNGARMPAAVSENYGSLASQLASVSPRRHLLMCPKVPSLDSAEEDSDCSSLKSSKIRSSAGSLGPLEAFSQRTLSERTNLARNNSPGYFSSAHQEEEGSYKPKRVFGGELKHPLVRLTGQCTKCDASSGPSRQANRQGLHWALIRAVTVDKSLRSPFALKPSTSFSTRRNPTAGAPRSLSLAAAGRSMSLAGASAARAASYAAAASFGTARTRPGQFSPEPAPDSPLTSALNLTRKQPPSATPRSASQGESVPFDPNSPAEQRPDSSDSPELGPRLMRNPPRRLSLSWVNRDSSSRGFKTLAAASGWPGPFGSGSFGREGSPGAGALGSSFKRLRPPPDDGPWPSSASVEGVTRSGSPGPAAVNLKAVAAPAELEDSTAEGRKEWNGPEEETDGKTNERALAEARGKLNLNWPGPSLNGKAQQLRASWRMQLNGGTQRLKTSFSSSTMSMQHISKTSRSFAREDLEPESLNLQTDYIRSKTRMVAFYVRLASLLAILIPDLVAFCIYQISSKSLCRSPHPAVHPGHGDRGASASSMESSDSGAGLGSRQSFSSTVSIMLAVIIALHLLFLVGESLGSNCGSGPGAIGSRSYRFLNASTGMSTPAELITNYLYLASVVGSAVVFALDARSCVHAAHTADQPLILHRLHLVVHVVRMMCLLVFCKRLKANFRLRLQTVVSVNKRRFVDRDMHLDLDLTYICDRLIAMALPCVRNAMYRNDVREVARFFASRHYGSFIVTNLCHSFEEAGNGNYDV